MQRFLVGVAFAVFGLTASAQRADVAGSSPSKLTTVLDDLARSVPQLSVQISPQRAEPGARLSIDALPKSVQDAARERRLRINENDEVQVYILLSAVDEETVRQLIESGVTVEVRDPARRRVQGRLGVSRLQAVAGLRVVEAIRLPTYARRRSGTVNTEGDAILYADAVRRQLALDGSGVRVGVVSDGLKGVFASACTTCAGVDNGPISKGDLPAATATRDSNGTLTGAIGGIVARSFRANGDLEGLPPASPACAFPGAGAEGTALLEIVHDIAPGAKLSFANGETDLEFAQAVNFLAASNDVVLDDVGFYGEPYDGTSAVSSNTAAALNSPAFPIRAYFTAVGNDADSHYYGAYADSGIDGTTTSGITTPGRLHLFQRTAETTDVLGLGARPYNVISLPQNGEVTIVLTWDDGFGASGNNYDLYLVQQSTGRVVARSTDVQSGRQDPVEAIDYVNNTGGQDFFHIVVQNVGSAAQARRLNIFFFQPQCAASGPQRLAPPRHERDNYNTASRSVSAQGDAGGSPVSVIAVGAVCSASSAAAGQSSSNESCLDTSNSTIESYSSRGPTLDGRTKPDIAAIDGVAVSGAGGFPSPFFGTSAATPHMGGIAALLLQGAPCLMNRTGSGVSAATARTTLRRMILGNAVGLSSPAPDNLFGFGRADAFASIQTTLPVAKGPTSLTVDGNTPFGASLTADQLGFADPNGCALTRLNWSGGCGTGPGTAMTCPFGASAVSVSASNNGLAYSTPADMQITVTGFSLAVSPGSATVAAGQSATYLVTVSPQAGPFRGDITLACGSLPPQVSCSFDPPTVSPGTRAVTSVLTISTTAAAPAAAARNRPPASSGWAGFSGLRVSPTMMIAWPLALSIVWVGLRRKPAWRAVAWATTCVAFTIASSGARLPALSASAMASGAAVFPASVTFASQTVGTTSPSQLVYITNIGGDTLNLSNITVSQEFSSVTNCAPTIAPGASCGVAVSFAPSAAGTRTGTLTFIDDAPGSPHQVSLTGTGVAAPTTTGGATPSGSYGVTISGAAGTLTPTVGVTLVVQ